MCVLTVKFEISSIILTTFKNEGGGLYHHPLSTSKRATKKPTQIRVKEQPIIAYSRNKNLRDLIGDTTIENNKVVIKQKLILTSGYCKPCFSRTNNLCNQVGPATTFKRNITSKTYQIFHQKNCKGSYIIYLLEYVRVSSKMSVTIYWEIRNRIQFKTYNHRKDVTRKDSISTSNYFDIEGHNLYLQKNLIKQICLFVFLKCSILDV